MNILHITPHLGGGIGSAILSWITKDNTNNHRIISLDKNKSYNWSQAISFPFFDGLWFLSDYEKILSKEIELSDVVIIHFWNHPLLYDCLINFSWPECRIVMWCHISGLHAPYCIPQNNILFCDKFVFTSPVSYNSPDIKELPPNLLKKIDVIWSTSLDFDKNKHVQRLAHKNFIVGYVGTADFAKLHPDFIKIVKNLDLPNIDFYFYSNDSQEILKKQVDELEITNRIQFKGQAKKEELAEIYSQFDILCYPLNPCHFGTCEQVLGEAMYYGAIPVVLNNPQEKEIVENKYNGIEVDSIDSFSTVIKYYYYHRDELEYLRKNAHQYSLKQYSSKITTERWNDLFLKLPEKQMHNWINTNDSIKIEPEILYAYSHGKYGKPFTDYIKATTNKEILTAEKKIIKLFNTNINYKSKSKGSVFQYHTFWPDNPILNEWLELLNKS